MKTQTTITKGLMGLLTFFILLFLGCTKDFEDNIIDNFDFSLNEEHDIEGFVFKKTRTTFSVLPEKEVTTVKYYIKYSVSEGEGYFLDIDGEILNANDTLNISKPIFSYDYMRLNKGVHKVKVLVWDSNSNEKEIELIYNTEYSNFSFLVSKGTNDFIVNTKNLLIANLIREDITNGSDDVNNFEITYQIENGIGKLFYGEEEFIEGEKYILPKGESELSYFTENPGNHILKITAKAKDGATRTLEINLKVRNKDYTFIANANQPNAYTGDSVPVNCNISELDEEGDTYTLFFTSGNNNGSFEYNGEIYAPGEVFTVPVGSFSGKYTGMSEGNHEIVFKSKSSSGVEKEALVNIQFDKYEEQFNLSISQSSEDKYENNPFQLTTVTTATPVHDPNVTYDMTFNFTGSTAGYIFYKGIIYREGETITLDYGSTPMLFYPETDENFTINFRVENSTGISQTVSESVVMFKKPIVKVKGEKHNISCGGWNGCDYEVRLYTCWDVSCTEAFNGASLQRVEVRIWNRRSVKYDTFLFFYNDARGTGVERIFILETEGKERDLRYLDQKYEVRVQDSNGQWSQIERGTIIRK